METGIAEGQCTDLNSFDERVPRGTDWVSVFTVAGEMEHVIWTFGLGKPGKDLVEYLVKSLVKPRQ